jgi:hypothetical protein
MQVLQKIVRFARNPSRERLWRFLHYLAWRFTHPLAWRFLHYLAWRFKQYLARFQHHLVDSMQLVQEIVRLARDPSRKQLARVQRHLVHWRVNWCGYVPHLGNERTAYILGLYGTGRWYVNGLILENIGERAKYFWDSPVELRFYPGPTSMIYSFHATMRHDSLGQHPPAVTSCILEAVRLGFADLIFVYRHPLDSLLTNWVWFSSNWVWFTGTHRDRVKFGIPISGVSQAYKNTDDLCAALEQKFTEFEAFAEGDPDCFATVGGPGFLSFPQFVEETELFLQSATLALRLEDFMIDPFKEFSKIVEVMSVDLDLSRLRVPPPKSKPYRYLAVKEKVPRFRNFIDELDEETKRRIEKMGYNV